MEKSIELRSYECSLDGKHWSSYNALSRGKAKMEFWRDIDMDCIEYTDIKCRVLGSIYTSDAFVRNAKYRNIEFAYCGMAVEVDGMKGVIVGHNDAANLDVLFINGKHKGQTLNCHPNWKITYFHKNGSIIKQF